MTDRTSRTVRTPGQATATAPTNIALVKYWGKRHEALRLPMNGSISLTLGGLEARTTVRFAPDLAADSLSINDEPQAGRPLQRVSRFLDRIRERADTGLHAAVRSTSTIPVAAGLASSAAGFAALAVSASVAAGLELSPAELSVLARLGSGSACRSIFGGLVEWNAGTLACGGDSHAVQLRAENEWPLAMAIAVIEAGEKETGSTDGMALSVTAPGYRHWLATVDADLAAARAAIEQRDFATLGLIAESSATKMHLSAATTHPSIVYWTEATAAVVKAVTIWRTRDGLQGYFTVDAGPNVCVLCRPADLDPIADRLARQPGVVKVFRCPAGPGARVVALNEGP